MTLHPDFVRLIVKHLPDELHNLLVEYGSGLMIGGGYCRDIITGATPKDIDIFATSEKVFRDATESLDWKDLYVTRRTANAQTFTAEDRIEIQFITRVYYEDHEDAIQSFDFSVCQVAVYFDRCFEEWVGICTPEFMEDLPNFRMRYMAPERDEDPGASVLRMMKFVARGWKISEADIARVVGRFVSRLSDPDAYNFENEEQATERVQKAFRRIGYAGRPSLEDLAADAGDQKFHEQNEEVPF